MPVPWDGKSGPGVKKLQEMTRKMYLVKMIQNPQFITTMRRHGDRFHIRTFTVGPIYLYKVPTSQKVTSPLGTVICTARRPYVFQP